MPAANLNPDAKRLRVRLALYYASVSCKKESDILAIDNHHLVTGSRRDFSNPLPPEYVTSSRASSLLTLSLPWRGTAENTGRPSRTSL